MSDPQNSQTSGGQQPAASAIPNIPNGDGPQPAAPVVRTVTGQQGEQLIRGIHEGGASRIGQPSSTTWHDQSSASGANGVNGVNGTH